MGAFHLFLWIVTTFNGCHWGYPEHTIPVPSLQCAKIGEAVAEEIRELDGRQVTWACDYTPPPDDPQECMSMH